MHPPPHAPTCLPLQLVVFTGALVIGYIIQRRKISWISEASAGLVLGIACGFIGWACGASESFAMNVAFSPAIFLLFIIPVIMFHAGYSLEVKPFFVHLTSICLCAFLGTTISTFSIGYMMWIFGVLGWCYSMPALYCLTFGAIISATDPVAVLAVFESLGANPDPYINVFGESMLNDAVALVGCGRMNQQ